MTQLFEKNSVRNVRLVKKGQVSIFLTLAVVLLLLVGGYFLFQNYANSQKFATDLTSPSLNPVQKFVLSCVDKSLHSGILLAASQGGYVQMPNEISRNPRLYISNHPDAPIKTPLWENQGNSYIPTYELMQQQLAKHIDQTISHCLQNLSTIADIADIQELSTPRATVKINEKDITAQLNYSISYVQSTSNQTINQFTYVLSVPLMQMMESAKALAKQVTDSQFFELATIDLMSSADPQIPMSNMQLSCSTPKWKVADVESNISQLLYQMIPRVRVAGAENLPFAADAATYQGLKRITPDDFSDPASGNGPIKQKVPRGYAATPEDAYEYNHLYINDQSSALASQLQKSDVAVTFDYNPTYGLDMAVRPSDGVTMQGSSGTGESNYLKFICIQVYHFTYDLLYPVQVSVIKENAFKDGTALALRFALPVQIQRNLPNKDGFSIEKMDATVPGGRLCEDKVGTTTTVRAINKATGQAIDGATVEFHCYKYACDLGKTSTSGSFRPQLLTSIPSFCSGGSVAISHPQYVPAETFFYSAPDQIQVDMFPLQNLTFNVALGPNPDIYTQARPSELTQNQEAVVHVVSNELDYETYAAFKPGQQNTLQVIAGKGTYNISVFVYETTDGTDASLVGGYIGTLSVLNSNLNHELLLYAKDYINPVPQDQVAARLGELANDSVIITSHAPGWS